MSPRALVTGATGLVGSHLVERLARDGWSVRAMVREPARAEWLRPLGATELAAADVLDAERFAAAAAGCDVVFHTAAAITPREGGWEAFRRLNIDGAGNAIAAAARSGARLLQLSSVAVYGPGTRFREDGRPTDEDTPLAPLPESAWYARSKRESEALVLDAHRAGRVWATAVRPDVIYGPRDRQFVPRLARLWSRFPVMPLIGGGRSTLAMVHAANVADGAVRAATTDAAGGRAFNLANDFDVTVRDLARLAGVGLGRRIVGLPVPYVAARGALETVKALARLLRIESLRFALGSTLNFIARDNPFTSERARKELGWNPTVVPEEGVPAAFRWAREHALESGVGRPEPRKSGVGSRESGGSSD